MEQCVCANEGYAPSLRIHYTLASIRRIKQQKRDAIFHDWFAFRCFSVHPHSPAMFKSGLHHPFEMFMWVENNICFVLNFGAPCSFFTPILERSYFLVLQFVVVIKLNVDFFWYVCDMWFFHKKKIKNKWLKLTQHPRPCLLKSRHVVDAHVPCNQIKKNNKKWATKKTTKQKVIQNLQRP